MKNIVQYNENIPIPEQEDKINLQWNIRKNKPVGSALIVIIVAMTIVSIMGVGILSLFSSSSFSELFINNRNKAYYLAQAGRQYATMTIINAFNAGDLATIKNLKGKFTVADGNGFYLSTTLVKAGVAVVQSTGIVNQGSAPNGNALETKQKIVFTVRDPTLVEGAATVGNITLNKNTLIDGYDSAAGPYVYVANSNFAVIQTNSTASGSIYVGGQNKSPAMILGSVYCGVGCNPNVAITTNNYGTITGTRGVAAKNNPAPVLNLPTGGTPVTINGSDGCTRLQTTNITEGKWLARSSSGQTADVNLCVNDSIINISGTVTLIVDGSLNMINTSKINLATGAMLILWVKTKLEVGGNTSINPGGAPTNVLIKGINMTQLNFVSASRTYCSIYAPGSYVLVDSTSEIFGSVYASTITMSGGAIHCDIALSESTSINVGY